MINMVDQSKQSFQNLDEKHKPKTITDIVGQPHLQAYLKTVVETGNLTHLLFYGPPGTGKTSTAVALSHDLLGKNFQGNFQGYNSSSDRGIGFIRREIGGLTITVPVGAAYQIIFLDEADDLTYDAQAALREIMQKHTATAKFIIACNYPEKIIQPIKDRCMCFAFYPLTQDIIVDRLKVICDREHVRYDDGALEAIAEQADGSLRKAIQIIDISRDRSGHIQQSEYQKVEKIREQNIKLLMESILTNDMMECTVQLNGLYKTGNKARDIFTEIIKMIDNDTKLAATVKQAMIDQTGQYEWRISQGANEKLQMRCYLNALCKCVTQ